MTKEEAIKYLESIVDTYETCRTEEHDNVAVSINAEDNEALEMAISALTSNNEILDKISAEIKELPKAHCIQVMDREDIPLLALDIIEKYKE